MNPHEYCLDRSELFITLLYNLSKMYFRVMKIKKIKKIKKLCILRHLTLISWSYI